MGNICTHDNEPDPGQASVEYKESTIKSAVPGPSKEGPSNPFDQKSSDVANNVYATPSPREDLNFGNQNARITSGFSQKKPEINDNNFFRSQNNNNPSQKPLESGLSSNQRVASSGPKQVSDLSAYSQPPAHPAQGNNIVVNTGAKEVEAVEQAGGVMPSYIKASEANKEEPATNYPLAPIPEVKRDFSPVSQMNPMAPEAQKMFESKGPRDPKTLPGYNPAANQGIVRHKKENSTFKGDLDDGTPNGFGVMVSSSGEVTEGIFSNGVPSSNLRTFSHDGSFYEGERKNNKPHGKGTLTKSNRSKIVCNTWENGVPKGKYSEYDSKGNLVFEGAKSEYGYEGHCTVKGRDYTAEGNFAKNLPQGPFKKRYFNGASYIGQVDKNLKEQGQGTFIFVDSRSFEGTFASGKPEGRGKLTTDYGKTTQQTFKNGQLV